MPGKPAVFRAQTVGFQDCGTGSQPGGPAFFAPPLPPFQRGPSDPGFPITHPETAFAGELQTRKTLQRRGRLIPVVWFAVGLDLRASGRISRCKDRPVNRGRIRPQFQSWNRSCRQSVEGSDPRSVHGRHRPEEAFCSGIAPGVRTDRGEARCQAAGFHRNVRRRNSGFGVRSLHLRETRLRSGPESRGHQSGEWQAVGRSGRRTVSGVASRSGAGADKRNLRRFCGLCGLAPDLHDNAG